MRRFLNFLLGEDLVNEQSNRELKEVLIGTAMGIAFGAVCLFVIYVCG